MRSIEEIFNDRTCYKFLDKEVDTKILKEMYNLMKLGPTSANCCPLRIIFVTSQAERERLGKCSMPANAEKIKSCPVTAIFAYDMKFYEQLPKLFPHNPGMKDYFTSKPEILVGNAMRNSTLQAAYFMVIARSFGLACGPMSGFDAEAVNKEFLSDTDYQANFLCNLGYRDGPNPYPKDVRLSFDEACTII